MRVVSLCPSLTELVFDLGRGDTLVGRTKFCVHPADRVAWLCGNSHELLEAYYGVLLAGAVLLPLNIRLAPAELRFVLDDARAAVLLRHPSLPPGGAPHAEEVTHPYRHLP